MKLYKKIFFLLLVLNLTFLNSYAVVSHIDGLEYVVRHLNSGVLGNTLKDKYDVYEIYFENRTQKTFSIPGYSIYLGVDFTSLQKLNSDSMSKTAVRNSVLNIAAGAASIAFGGIAKTAANTAIRQVNFRTMTVPISGDEALLSTEKTYIIYPGDGLLLYFIVNKNYGQLPNQFRFVCRDEESNINTVLINNTLDLRDDNDKIKKEVNAKKIEDDTEDGVTISDPSNDIYK